MDTQNPSHATGRAALTKVADVPRDGRTEDERYRAGMPHLADGARGALAEVEPGTSAHNRLAQVYRAAPRVVGHGVVKRVVAPEPDGAA